VRDFITREDEIHPEWMDEFNYVIEIVRETEKDVIYISERIDDVDYE